MSLFNLSHCLRNTNLRRISSAPRLCIIPHHYLVSPALTRHFHMSHPNFFEKSFQQIDQLIEKVEKSMPQQQKSTNPQQSNKKSNNKKPQKPVAPKYSSDEDVARFQSTNIQVSRVASAKPLEGSDKLLFIKLETGDGEKQVVAGLQQFYKPEELEGRFVCAILNLKPAKLAGTMSEAMLLAGSAPDANGAMQVKLLEAPNGSELGDRVFVVEDETKPLEENIFPPTDRVNEKQWKKAVPLLKVMNGKAIYNGMVMRTLRGDVAVPLPDGSEIH